MLIFKKIHMENNIYLLPSEKPSKLFLNTLDNKLFYSQTVLKTKTPITQLQHLYITDNSEIKEGDWYVESLVFPDVHLVDKLSKKWENQNSFIKRCKRIILTTHPDLTNDNVQCISDDFLKSFVENQMCEHVEL